MNFKNVAKIALLTLLCCGLTYLAAMGGLYPLWLFPLGMALSYQSATSGRTALLTAVVGVLLFMAVVLGNFVYAALCVLMYVLPGAAVGYGLTTTGNFRRVVMLAGGAVLLGLVVQLMQLQSQGGIAVLLDNAMQTAGGELRTMLNQLGESVPAEKMAELSEAIAQTMATVKTLVLLYLPSVFILFAAFVGYALVAAVIFYLRKAHGMPIGYIPFYHIGAGRKFCYLVVLISFVLLFFDGESTMMVVLKNMELLFDVYLAVCGLSFIDWKFKKVLQKGFLRFLVYLGAGIIAYLLLSLVGRVLTLIGLFDGFMGLRRIRKEGEHGHE